ncbi:hypothetical protein L596_004939 [Steinernema carpocapsae]|uniref:Uncharacterized protein n=1 Tax=Steinernema carpocapsae TaxID=34508 RepID=A0A4V6I8G3_STECR|nr:hypothetical protein L596_004939 [Steinernema carpocapsae]
MPRESRVLQRDVSESWVSEGLGKSEEPPLEPDVVFILFLTESFEPSLPFSEFRIYKKERTRDELPACPLRFYRSAV